LNLYKKLSITQYLKNLNIFDSLIFGSLFSIERHKGDMLNYFKFLSYYVLMI